MLRFVLPFDLTTPPSSGYRCTKSYKERDSTVANRRHGPAIPPGIQCHHLPDLWSILVRLTLKSLSFPKLIMNVCYFRRVSGLYVAWHWRRQSKSEFLAANRTQKGQTQQLVVDAAATSLTLPTELFKHWHANRQIAIPLALNFIASGECSCRHSRPSV